VTSSEKENVMTILSGTCHHCLAHIEVPLDALLVAVDDDNGRFAYICPDCESLVDDRLSADGLTVLLSAGVQPIDIGDHGALVDDDLR
jgi:hypothetical protein